PAPVLGGDLGDGTFDVGPGGVVLFEPWCPGLGSGGAEQILMRVDGHRPAGFGGGTPLAQRAVGAQSAEGDGAGRAHRPGVAVRASDGTVVLVEGEVVEGEPVGDRAGQRLWFDDNVMAGVAGGVPGFAGAVGRGAV